MEDWEKRFALSHPVGYCKVPSDIDAIPAVTATRTFMAPARIDLRDMCAPTKDQGSKPWCAAYSAASFAENILWRVRDYIEAVDPTWIYAWAKAHDGSPATDGTTLTAVLDALRGKLFDHARCQVKVIRRSRLAFKYAIHKFGCCLGAFDVDSSWWGVTRSAPVITGAGDPNQGGHAVLCVGYSREGVWIQNSWGSGDGTGRGWGEFGFAQIPWAVWDAEWLYGAVLSNCLDGLTLNA